MKITICCSIQFVYKIKEIALNFEAKGHEVVIPDGAERILSGEITLEKFLDNVNNGEGARQKIKHDVIRQYFKEIGNSDVILILNLPKKGIDGYIGGNVFLEMGFAYVQNKKIFLYNPIPEMPYKEELITMQPIVINGNLNLIK